MGTLTSTIRGQRKKTLRLPGWLRVIGLLCVLVFVVADFAFTVIFYRHPLGVMDEALHARLRLAGIRSEYVTVGSYRVHYFVGGQGKPLLLIHGLGARAEDWAPEMPDYTQHGFRVYAVDLLGCGRTDRPDIDYTIQQQTDMIHGFLAALHIQQTDVIGWSMGGWVALQFALEHPTQVQRLVVMDSAGLRFPTSLTPQVFEPRTIPQLKHLEALLVPHPYALPGFFDHALLRAMERNYPVVHRTVHSMAEGKDLLDGKLDGIQAPVLLVWGVQDALIPVSVAMQMHRAMPQSVLQLYDGCGHIGPATCAGKIVPRVIEFLQKDSAPEGGMYRY